MPSLGFEGSPCLWVAQLGAGISLEPHFSGFADSGVRAVRSRGVEERWELPGQAKQGVSKQDPPGIKAPSLGGLCH